MICVVDLVDILSCQALSRANLSVMKAGMDSVLRENERKERKKMTPVLEVIHYDPVDGS